MYHENQTKDQILRAALKMLNQTGYGSLSISELARQAKLSKQNLYYHYDSMEDILLELAGLWSQTGQECTINALASTKEAGSQKVLAMSQGMFVWMQKYPELSRLGLVLFQTSTSVKKLDQLMSQARLVARQRLRDFLLQDPVFEKMSAAILGDIISAIHAVMYGSFLYVVAMNDFAHLKKHEKNCGESLNRLLQSYR